MTPSFVGWTKCNNIASIIIFVVYNYFILLKFIIARWNSRWKYYFVGSLGLVKFSSGRKFVASRLIDVSHMSWVNQEMNSAEPSLVNAKMKNILWVVEKPPQWDNWNDSAMNCTRIIKLKLSSSSRVFINDILILKNFCIVKVMEFLIHTSWAIEIDLIDFTSLFRKYILYPTL